MSTEAVDRRVRRTRKQLRECLVTLLKQKKVQDITVRELTELADLNRGTFYLHYKDVFDLLEKTESELLDDFNQLVMKHDAEDLKKHPYGIFVEIYTLAYDNADLVEILLTKTEEKDVKKQQLPQNAYSYKLYDRIQGISISLHIPADTRSAFPVISVQSPVSIQCCWQS